MSGVGAGASATVVGREGMGVRVPRQVRRAAVGPDRREREEVLRAFGERLRARRVAAGVSQERLAAWCFMRRSEISHIERGARAPDLPALLVLAEMLGVSAGGLIDGLRAPVRRVGTAQVLDLIVRQPGISTDGIAASLGLPFSYAAEIAVRLQSTGQIAPQRTGWQPAAQTRRGEGVEG